MDRLTIGAIDIGGTKLAATVARADGPVLRMSAPTPKSGSIRALPERAIALLDETCKRSGVDPAEIRTVGVSSCGPFSTDDGLIGLVSPNICGAGSDVADLPNDWDVIPLESVLRERFDNLVIENDGVAALAAERSFGALQGENNCAYVTWSTGIGFGLCVDGRILRGKNGNAGHAGHMLLSETSDALCGCGNRGDLEALVSGRNLGNRYGQSAAAIFDTARKGDPHALAVTTEAARWFGRALYNLTATLDLAAFAVGGSVWLNHGEWLLPIVQEELLSHLPALTKGVRVCTAGLGTHVGDLAALSLVLSSEWATAWRSSAPWHKTALAAG
jgi:glucokinase